MYKNFNKKFRIKNNKYSLMPLFIAAMFLLVVSFVHADDDREDDKDDDDDRQVVEVIAAPVADTAAQDTSTKMVKQTIIVTPAQIITSTIMKDFVLPDSDRDGVADEEDEYPNIPNYLVVQDSNLDGIDDQYQIQIVE